MKYKGFSLLEIMIVIAIIATILGMLIFIIRPSDVLKDTRSTKRTSESLELEKALNTYISENGAYPASMSVLIADGYYDICKYGITAGDCINLDDLVSANLISDIPVDTDFATATRSGYSIKYYHQYGDATIIDGAARTDETPDTIGLWRFDENTGSTTGNSSGTLGSGTLVNSPTWAIGKYSNGLEFDGINDFVSIPDNTSLDLNNDFTISLWFKPQNTFNGNSDYSQGIIDKGAFNIFLDKSDGKLKAEIINSTSPVPAMSYDNALRVNDIVSYKGKLYAGVGYWGSADGSGDVYVFDGTNWTLSYDGSRKAVSSLAVYAGKLYAGTYGTSGGHADVYVFDDISWNLAYDVPNIPFGVEAMGVYNNKLYIGMSGGDRIRSFNGTTWNLEYAGNIPTLGIEDFAVYNGALYAAYSTVNGTEGYVYKYDGSSWSTANNTPDPVTSFRSVTSYNGELFVGLHGSCGGCGYGDIFKYDGSLWTKTYDSASNTYDRIYSMLVYSGYLLPAGSGGFNDADILKYNTNAWSLFYDDTSTYSEIYSQAIHNGDLYQGYGSGDILLFDKGSQVSSTRSTWDVGTFYHVALTKEGSSLNLYINGILENTTALTNSTLETNDLNLYVGKLYGSRGSDSGEGLFNGTIDELRIYGYARNQSEIVKDMNNTPD